MNEQALTGVLRRLGITDFKRTRRGWIDFPCPLAPWTHQNGTDRSGSAGAKINDEGVSAWVCHACKHHGRVSGLVSILQRFRGTTYEGLMREADMADAMPTLTMDFGEFETAPPPEPEPLNPAIYDGLYPAAWDEPEARTYLERRDISEEAAHSLNLLFDPDQRRILFPVRDAEQRLWGFTGRAVDPKPTMTLKSGEVVPAPKIRDYAGLPKRLLILGEERWRQGKPKIIVEGLFGYAHLISTGVEDMVDVGALMGSVMTDEKATKLRLWDEPVYLMLDNDEGGDVGLYGPHLPEEGQRDWAAGAVAKLSAYLPLYVPEWPEGKIDPDQLTRSEITMILRDTPLWNMS